MSSPALGEPGVVEGNEAHRPVLRVPKMPSTSREQEIFMDEPTEPICPLQR